MEEKNLQFQIQNIPEGESTESVYLSEDDLDFDDSFLQQAEIDVRFFKSERFIDINFDVQADLKLICDRSLEEFSKTISGSYKVVYSADETEIVISEKSAVKPIPPSLELNIENEVRDTILLQIPVKKLHPKFIDSKGKAIDFEVKKFGDSEQDEDRIDPRWEALKKLKTEN